jgi:glycosyltransferase involved in cell wall biosynthesis
MKVMIAGYTIGQGGIQSHLRWLSKSLRESGIETLVISLGSDASSGTNNGQNRPENLHLCNPYPKNIWTKLGWTKLQRLKEVHARIEDFSPDVYLAVGTGWNLFIPALLSPVKMRRIFHEVMSGIPQGWRDSRWSVRWGFDEVIGQSPTVMKQFVRSFGWNKSTAALPAMPEPLELTASLPQVTAKRVELGRAKAAIFSRLAPHKQAFWLVQQWDLLQDVLGELHIHGTGSEEPLIREYIANRGIGDRVKCFGCYPEGQAYVDLLSSYDLTLLPTIGDEGAPLVLLESMACGVPFVAYGVGGIPDYGVENPHVLVVPPQGNQFISGVKKMANLLAENRIDSSKLQQFYLEKYSYKVLTAAWLSYLTEPVSLALI